MKTKTVNLQPWLDYFALLQEYERNGYLDVMPDKCEAYVTRPALMTLAGASPEDGVAKLAVSAARVVRRIRAYAGWRSQKGEAFMDAPFAMHVVMEDEPHDPLWTVVLSRRRKWWKLWMKTDCFDVVRYE